MQDFIKTTKAMIGPVAPVMARWRFLVLTLLICAWLLLAGVFTQIYMCLLTWDPGSFSLPVDVAARPVHLLHADMTYFSLVTLATVGYGDILPVTSTARMLAMFEAVTGQFYVAVVVAIFVGMYARQRLD
jgi:hypothetical protein